MSDRPRPPEWTVRDGEPLDPALYGEAADEPLDPLLAPEDVAAAEAAWQRWWTARPVPSK